MSISDRIQAIRYDVQQALHLSTYDMNTISGDFAVQRMVRKAKRMSESEVQEFVNREMERIEKRHPEVFDTDVRECIQEELEPGYNAYA